MRWPHDQGPKTKGNRIRLQYNHRQSTINHLSAFIRPPYALSCLFSSPFFPSSFPFSLYSMGYYTVVFFFCYFLFSLSYLSLSLGVDLCSIVVGLLLSFFFFSLVLQKSVYCFSIGWWKNVERLWIVR